MQGFAEVTICILDVDDNCPVFSQAVYVGLVSENAAPGTPVNVVRISYPIQLNVYQLFLI